MAALSMFTQNSLAGARSNKRPAFSSHNRRSAVVRAATAIPAEFKAVRPVGDRVLVKVDKEESRTAGGVLLPVSAQKKPTAGSVVSLGDAKTVKGGDRVVYSKYAGTEIEVAGESHVLLKEEDCIGVLPSDDRISKLQPLGDRVLIKCAEAASKTAGGVLLTSEAAEKPNFGVVVAVGTGKSKEDGSTDKVNLEVGATVMYSKYSGTEFEDTDETPFIVVRESDILASLS